MKLSAFGITTSIFGALLFPTLPHALAEDEPALKPEVIVRATPSVEQPLPAPEESPTRVPRLLGLQYTSIRQHLAPFGARYSGPLSLRADGDLASTHTFGAYFGMPLSDRLQVYLDIEMFKGAGISNATGLGGLTNGDVVRQGSADLGKRPYVARSFVRYIHPLEDDTTPVFRAMDQLPGHEAATRLEFKLGRLAVVDDFDRNRYANSARNQFQNWSLFNNTAWDFAADTRGFTNGYMIGYVGPNWALKFGAYLMPSTANGQDLDAPLSKARGENLELTMQPNGYGTVVRLLAYRNIARMGSYRAAIAGGTPPDVAADDRDGRKKTGLGLNLEQPIADDGETGVFMRLGWNDGKTENFAFTEVDRHLSFGLQLAGNRWQRPHDRVGIALAFDGLSRDHRDYLAAGGHGFVLGDGALSYGTEKIFEAYYRIQVGKYVQLSPDFQYIQNPGYNRDRGPARVAGLRLHVEY